MSLSTRYAEYVIFAIIISTYAALTFFSQLVPYKVPATTDKFLIVDGNIDYLYDLVIRLDHMLEVIYFGFLIALLTLGLCYGQLQRRATYLEQVVNVLAQTAMVTGVSRVVGIAADQHPAYGTVDEKENDAAATLDSLVQRIEHLETLRAVDMMRIATLELNAIHAQQSGVQGECAVLPPYHEDSAQPDL
ncbi:hypothetical protein BDU57DRAFT_331142 [Ampelomyces quisqualis]|uniref:Uncharacterized protein n=1 Tax=Ampelomyces quisqualis TaxID=50730 RepID=A0A6A5QGT4_AMPQU|nr:hypothetical protein BDU57DRAFT_331142 [Ampelomyces quisqualis]